MNPADTAVNSRAAPVIVMAYAGSGADQLRAALSAFPGLTCTSGTGIVPLCHNAIATWRAVDGRTEEGFSPFAAASVRALTAGLTTAILARDGGNRWCEFISAPPAAARTFARLYPGTLFLIVHRRADAVIRAILDANRWGLAGPEFAPFLSAHPGSTVAALAGYWVTHTAPLLEFEQAHRGSCLRVRIEDVRADTEQALLDIGGFLSLDSRDAAPRLPAVQDGDSSAEPVLPAAGLPFAQIPAVLLAQLNDLHRRLGYPPVTAAEA
jgi:hypothetical protein